MPRTRRASSVRRFCLFIWLALSGCAHERSLGQSGTEVVGVTEDAFASAYEAVKSGARQTARAGEWIFRQAGEGTVRVTRATGAAIGAAPGRVSDAYITSKLKTEYGVDRDIDASRIHVDTDHGIVTLWGTVDSEYEARKAIAEALDTRGVHAVRSELRWPTSSATRRSYER